MNSIFTYENGVYLALILSISKCLMSVGLMTSNLAYNLAQLDSHFNLWSCNFSPTKQVPFSKGLYFFYALIVAPLFSWLTVLSVVMYYFFSLGRKMEKPDATKRILFDLSVSRYSKEVILQLDEEYKQERKLKKVS